MDQTEVQQLSEIGQVAVTVHDLDRAVAFYRDVVGLPFMFQVPNMAFFDCAGVRLMLGLSEEKEGHGSSILYFRAADIQAMATQLSERGASFVSEPHLVAEMPDHDLWMAFFEDSEGNTMALMSEVRSEAG